MSPSPSKADPRVRAACEEALAYTGPQDTHNISVSSMAENVTRGLRVVKEGMSDSNDVSDSVRRELYLAVRCSEGARRLAPATVHALVDNLEIALLKSLAPEDPPTTPLLSSDRIQLSPAETYIKALEEAMIRGRGWGNGGWTSPSGGTHDDGGVMDLEYRPLYGDVHFVLEDSPALKHLAIQDRNPPDLEALDRWVEDEWAPN